MVDENREECNNCGSHGKLICISSKYRNQLDQLSSSIKLRKYFINFIDRYAIDFGYLKDKTKWQIIKTIQKIHKIDCLSN